MEEIYRIIDLLDLTIGPPIVHLFDITKCSEEAQRFLEVFSEEEILCSAKYKNHKPLPYDDSLEDSKSKIFLGTYDGVNEYTIVSQQHYEELIKYKWNLYKNTDRTGYEYKYAVGQIGKYMFKMSIYIKGYSKGMIVDHINGNSIDNSFPNLRHATRTQNSQNKPKKINCSSLYSGVHYDDRQQKYCIQYSDIKIGTSTDEVEAGKMYDKFVLLHPNLGKQSKTNNLITWDEIKNLKFEDVFPEKIKREIPKYILYDKIGYRVSIQYNKTKYTKREKTLESAIITKEILLDKIKKIKDDELNEHNKKIIVRNLIGQAIISVKDVEYIVDDFNWHNLSLIKWKLDKSGYATNNLIGTMHNYLKKHIISEIKKLYEDANIVTDHINNNINDNIKLNLRINTQSGNASNKKGIGLSKYKNITCIKNSTFRTNIKKNNEMYYGGYYETEIEAVVAAVIMNRKLYKTYAYNYDISYNDFIEHKDSVITNLKSKFNK
jgi:hypothetical protein